MSLCFIGQNLFAVLPLFFSQCVQQQLAKILYACIRVITLGLTNQLLLLQLQFLHKRFLLQHNQALRQSRCSSL